MVFFIGLLILGMPIACGIGISSILAIFAKGTLPMMVIPQRLIVAVDSFPLLAVPFFVLAGDVMLQGGISKRLIALAKVMVGKLTGGLAYCTIIASAFFGAISGSAAATTAAIGGMMYFEMLKDQYDEDFTAFLGAISGTLGLLIPPSIALIIYGTQTNTSVGDLFMVSAVAGVITTFVYMLTARLSMKKKGESSAAQTAEKASVWAVFKEAFWGLLSPVIILGGIYSGIFTATEAAAIAVVYSLVVGFFVYRELTIKKLIDAFVSSALTTGMVLLLVSVASLFSWILTVEGVAGMLSRVVSAYGVTLTTFFISVNVIYLILGMFIETIPIIILTTPIFFPMAMALGVNPIHFGVVTVFNLAFGMVTPPFGLDLFVAAGYSKRSIPGMVKAGWPYYISGVALIFLFSFFPQLIMWVK